MKLEVDFARGGEIAVREPALLVVAELAQALEIRRTRPLRRQARGLQLESSAHLVDLAVVERLAAYQEAHRGGDVPGVHFAHLDASSRGDPHEAARCEGPHRLAHHGAGDVELLP